MKPPARCSNHRCVYIDQCDWLRRKKTGRRGLANNNGSGQPAHPRSLISAFVIRLLEISYLGLLRTEFQFSTYTVVMPLRQFGSRHPLRCYGKIPPNKGWQKRELSNMFASRLHRLVNNLCCFAKTETKSDFKSNFLQLYLKNVNYGLVIIIRFCHWLIIHDDETVIIYFMPRHQTLKFSYNFKAKRYNVNLMNKNQSEP